MIAHSFLAYENLKKYLNTLILKSEIGKELDGLSIKKLHFPSIILL
jgi:hypothetical protein